MKPNWQRGWAKKGSELGRLFDPASKAFKKLTKKKRKTRSKR